MQVNSAASVKTASVSTPPRTLTVSQAQAALKNNSRISFALADTAANIKANLAVFAKLGAQIKSVAMTDTPDKLSVTASDIKNYADLLSKTPSNTLVVSDSFDAMKGSLTELRKLNSNIKTLVIAPTPEGTKQKIEPYDSFLWAKSVNGRFEISSNVLVNGKPVAGAPDVSQSLANNYLAIKALDDRGLLAGVESIGGGTITANVDQAQKLSAIFQKYSTEFYLNIRDTSANISKGIEFIAANNSKLNGITQIGNIKPLEITREQNFKADKAWSKMKNAYSLKLYR